MSNMKSMDSIVSKGQWLIQDWDPKDVPTDPDVLLEWYEKHGHGRMFDNLIVNSGLIEMAKRNINTSSSINDRMQVGSSNTPTLPTQTAIVSSIRGIDVTSATLSGTTERYLGGMGYHSTLQNTVGEMGLLASNGVLMSRVVVTPTFALIPGRAYTVMAMITHTSG